MLTRIWPDVFCSASRIVATMLSWCRCFENFRGCINYQLPPAPPPPKLPPPPEKPPPPLEKPPPPQPRLEPLLESNNQGKNIPEPRAKIIIITMNTMNP